MFFRDSQLDNYYVIIYRAFMFKYDLDFKISLGYH